MLVEQVTVPPQHVDLQVNILPNKALESLLESLEILEEEEVIEEEPVVDDTSDELGPPKFASSLSSPQSTVGDATYSYVLPGFKRPSEHVETTVEFRSDPDVSSLLTYVSSANKITG